MYMNSTLLNIVLCLNKMLLEMYTNFASNNSQSLIEICCTFFTFQIFYGYYKKNCLTKFKETYQSNETKIFTKMTLNSYTGKIRLPKTRICTFFGFERAKSNTVTQLQLQMCMVFIFSCEKVEKQCVVFVVVAHSCCLKKGDKMTV